MPTANPTSSSAGFRVVRVGAGLDYANLGAFAGYMGSQDLVANAEILCAEVYEDQSTHGIGFNLSNTDAQHYCIIRPVPGLDVNAIESSGPLTLGSSGIAMNVVTNDAMSVGNGVFFDNWRVNVTGTDTTSSGAIKYRGGAPAGQYDNRGFRKSRFNISTTNKYSIEIGDTYGSGSFLDNLVAFQSGAAGAAIGCYGGANMYIRRNTFVRLGGSGSAINDLANGDIRDNAFCAMGAAAISNAFSNPISTNNVSDNAADSGVQGFTTAAANSLLTNYATDFRPKSGGPLIGAASSTAINTNDLRGLGRGASPDIGADQLNPVAALLTPTGTITSTAQAGQVITVNFSTTSNPGSAIVQLVPASSNPNGAQANTGTVTLGTNAGVATFSDVAPGNYTIKITLTNPAGSADCTGTLALTVANTIPAAVPTQSSSGFRVVRIGRGLDYENMGAFAAYMATQDLIVNNEILCAEVYENQTISGLALLLKTFDDTRYCIIRAVPGRSVNDLETGALTYGTSGVQLTVDTSNYCNVGSGTLITGFRLRITGTSASDRAGMIFTKTNQPAYASIYQSLQYCRVSVEAACAYVLESGNNYGNLQFRDNLVVFAASSPSMAIAAYGGGGTVVNVDRNTFVRLGMAGSALRESLNGSLNDNAFVNMGTKAVGTIISVVPSGNVSDNAADNGINGFTVAAAGTLVANAANDFRPKAGGALIAHADASATSVPDLYGHNRGRYPDVGVMQLALVVPTPIGTITSQPAPSGQNLTVQFSTQYAPTSGTATLDPASINPNGATSTSGVVTLASGSGQAVFTNVPPGNYTLSITLSNEGGIRLVDGSQPVSINAISGNSVAPTSTGSAIVAPSAPQNVAATAGDGRIIVAFAAPASNGGATVTSYTARASTGQTASGPSSPLTIIVPNGTPVTATVTAANSAGPGTASASSNQVTPAAPGSGGGGGGGGNSGRSITLNLVDINLHPQASLSGLKWAWFDQSTPNLFIKPTDTGDVETTDANGSITIQLAHTGLVSGAVGWLIVTDSSGNPALAHNAFSGPVIVG